MRIQLDLTLDDRLLAPLRALTSRRVALALVGLSTLGLGTAFAFDWGTGGPSTWIGAGKPISAAKLQSNLEALAAATVLPGTIIAFAGPTCPKGYLPADGTSYAKTGTYGVLFAAIGPTWGENGTSFKVPNLGNRVLRGAGPAGDGLGGEPVALGSFQEQATAPNGLANASSLVSGTVGGQDGSHTHTWAKGAPTRIDNSGSSQGFYGQGALKTQSTDVASSGGHGHEFSLVATAQVISGDVETRQKAYGVNFCIKY